VAVPTISRSSCSLLLCPLSAYMYVIIGILFSCLMSSRYLRFNGQAFNIYIYIYIKSVISVSSCSQQRSKASRVFSVCAFVTVSHICVPLPNRKFGSGSHPFCFQT
jgi:hypothetical protein